MRTEDHLKLAVEAARHARHCCGIGVEIALTSVMRRRSLSRSRALSLSTARARRPDGSWCVTTTVSGRSRPSTISTTSTSCTRTEFASDEPGRGPGSSIRASW
jgi:hypothetical protein